MNRRYVVMAMVCIIMIYFLFSSVQVILQGSPEITYEILKYDELTEEVLIMIEAKTYNPLMENGSK